MSEQMEVINVEEIMQEIKTQIEERGYTKSELRFADVAAAVEEGSGEIDEFFELHNFGLTVDKMNARRTVMAWRAIGGNKIAVIAKKIIRKLTKFYIEPIVKDQNQFNFYTTSAMSQLYAKMEEEQEIKFGEMQRRIEELETKCKALEEKCGE